MTRKKTSIPELLVLECFEDKLSDAQLEMYKKAELEMNEFQKKLDSYNNAKFVSSSGNNQSDVNAAKSSLLIQGSQGTNNVMVMEQNGGMHLVMGSAVPSAQGNNLVVAKNSTIRIPSPTTTANRTPRIISQTRMPSNSNGTLINSVAVRPRAPTASTNAKYPIYTAQNQPPAPTGLTKIQMKPNPAQSQNVESAGNITVRTLKPKINQANDVVDLTDDDIQEAESTADQKEVTIGKVSEKTFPSLVVIVRVFLRAKDIPGASANQERMTLDTKVKKILMLNPTGFTEFLLQQGLLKCQQSCAQHRGMNGRSHNLKLGMYTDTSKFPYSGGYVWVSECCPTTFVSVFSGSLFEGAPHPPTTLLKLIYHWSCQTIVQNVLQWVKVDNLYIKTMYTNLRAVCTAAIHEKYGKLGGNNRKIEVGVISLGTTTQDGNMKHIKVEVLGVLETETKRLRLKALEPIADNDRQFMKKKFLKILEPLQQWVEKDSVIVTDYTVDKTTCYKMGFTNIVQNLHNVNAPSDQPTNQTIMDYLRKVIPKMFQNTLSLLSRQIIQQFLDELVWRETWGPIPSRAFDTIIQNISEQTRLDTGGSLMHRLARIAANPLKNWKYDKWAMNCKTSAGTNTAMKTKDSFLNEMLNEQIPSNQSKLLERALLQGAQPDQQPAQSEHMQAAMIALEPYYYGTLTGDPKLATEKYNYSFKCIMCKEECRSVIKFTEHLISHAFNKNARDNSETKELCKLCLKICPKTNSQNLNTHRVQVHSDRHNCKTLCKICSVKHRDEASLQSHMIASHCELDMPYHCEICNYRTSILDNIHAHFGTIHNRGTKGYCPYCLKVMQFAKLDGTNLENNHLRFVLHIQKHQLTVNRKCEKCLLNFTNRHILKDHQDNWHQSCTLLDDVERYSEECSLMTAPLIDPLPTSTATVESSCKGTLKLNFDYANEYCCECDGRIDLNHFVGHLSCSKCRFQTCCNYSMKEHNALVHGTSLLHLRPPIIGRAPTFANPMYCLCGYSSRNGNYMATHLMECRRDTCYPSKRTLEIREIKEEVEDSTTTILPRSINDVMMRMKKTLPFDDKRENIDETLQLVNTCPPSSMILNSPQILLSDVTTTSSPSSTLDTPILPKFLASTPINEAKDENMKMAVDCEEQDDAMECEDVAAEDSMTIDDSSTEAMILD